MKRRTLTLAIACVAVLLPPAAGPAEAAASTGSDATLVWNSIAVANVRASSPVKFQTEGLIYMSYVQAAVYDAVVTIAGRYLPYHRFTADPAGASLPAAVAAAARTALDYYLPDRAAAVDADYTAYLGTLPDSGKSTGIAVGEAAANDIIAFRADDGRNAPTGTYGTPGPVVPGAWQVVPPATTAQTPWVAFMRPFLLDTAAQFRSDPPPALSTREYAGELNEVKAYGALTSTVRTPAQTAVAYLWNANVINQFNQLLSDVATRHGLDLVDTARLLAMGEMVTTDAGIGCFEAKYHYLFWRPYMAIRDADLDGNPATEPDPTWLPLVNTPNHPEDPSAHGCVISALIETISMALDTRRLDVGIWGATNGGTTLTTARHFSTVSEINEEVVDARVWIGFHYRQSVIQGQELGRKVAHWALRRYFQPTED
jgi:hypothetical protein